MRIFVTGAAGVVGRAFAREATARGHRLLALERGTHGDPDGAIEVVRGDLAAPPWAAIERFAPDAVLHLAWIATPGVYLDSPLNDALAEQTIALMRGLSERGVGHVAGVGTCIEYAPSAEPLAEDAPVAPASAYAIAKHRVHAWMAQHDWGGRTSWSWLRVFHPYGLGEHPDRTTSHFARALRAGEAITLRTPGSVKDWIHLRDLARALGDVLEARLPGAVNLGTGEGASVRTLAETVADAAGVARERVRDAAEPAVDPHPALVADATRLRSTGWRPRVALREGVEEVVRALGPAA